MCSDDLIISCHGDVVRWSADAESALSMFTHISEEFPGSYGVMTVIDSGGERYSPGTVVSFRARKGNVIESVEEWLTPFDEKATDPDSD